MKLILLNALTAEIFGLPPNDTTEEEIIAEYQAKGWDEDKIKNHIQCAVDAGAYRREAWHKSSSPKFSTD